MFYTLRIKFIPDAATLKIYMNPQICLDTHLVLGKYAGNLEL